MLQIRSTLISTMASFIISFTPFQKSYFLDTSNLFRYFKFLLDISNCFWISPSFWIAPFFYISIFLNNSNLFGYTIQYCFNISLIVLSVSYIFRIYPIFLEFVFLFCIYPTFLDNKYIFNVNYFIYFFSKVHKNAIFVRLKTIKVHKCRWIIMNLLF